MKSVDQGLLLRFSHPQRYWAYWISSSTCNLLLVCFCLPLLTFPSSPPQAPPVCQTPEYSGRLGVAAAASHTSSGRWTPSWFGPRTRGERFCRPSLTCTTPTSARYSVKHPPPQPTHTRTHFSFALSDGCLHITNQLPLKPKWKQDACTAGSVCHSQTHTHTHTPWFHYKRWHRVSGC